MTIFRKAGNDMPNAPTVQRRRFPPARLGLTLLALFGLAAPASALEMMVWDGNMETKLAYGELYGSTLRGQIVSGAGGPVVVLFSRSEAERNKGTYSGLHPRYEGDLRGGQIWLKGGSQTLEQLLTAQKLRLDLSATIPAASGGR